MLDEKTKLIMKTLTVLYVEDEKMIRDELSQSLERKFSEVLIAENGLEGLELYKSSKPDLIITDLKMPKMDGLSMIEEIRKENIHIPIITITAYSDVDNIKRALELKVDRFISKPTTKKELDLALYKSTISIIKQKEIDDRDQIIKTILGWKPYMSIICNKNDIKHVTSEFLGIMNTSQQQDFLDDMKNMDWTFEDNTSKIHQIDFENTSELLDRITKKDDKYFVFIENKKKNSKERFEAKAKLYSHTELYLLSLFKVCV